MDESNAMRAITVGVSVFIAIITISGILTYYSIARNMAKRIGGGNDVGQKYSEEIEDILIRGSYKGSNSEYLTGTEVRNLINYFYKNENVKLDVEIDTGLGSSSSGSMNVENINNNESYFGYWQFIMPNQHYKIVENSTNKEIYGVRYYRYLDIDLVD